MRRLNIFVDETGEFGFGKGASELYGVSFTFHEQENDIMSEVEMLNNRLQKIGYAKMIHMADLIMKRGDYSKLNINIRRSIFKAIYHFARKVKASYRTIIVDKRYINKGRTLKQELSYQINKMINENEKYFKKFDKIVLYYDNGQESLATILDSIFYRFEGFEHRVKFDHEEKRLFQVSDMLTYIDKYNYKYKNKLAFTRGEKYFFTDDELRKIIKTLDNKRF